MKTQSALITADVIKWARKKAHYDLKTAAKKIGVTPKKLEEWENGKNFPTMTQARKMSQVYRRPLASFYLPHPPKGFPLLKDFRTVEGKAPKYSTALIFLMRQIQERQIWLKDYLKEQEGQKPLKFIGSAQRNSSPKTLSKNIIKTLWGSEKEYSQKVPKKIETLLKNCINQCEEKGIFISRTSHLNPHNVISVKEARGFVISDEYAPFIFINSSDSKPAQLFTLFHELAHLWLDVSGVPDHFSIGWKSNRSSTEFLCNQTAAEILMPEESIKNFSKMEELEEVKNFVEEKHKKFPVSHLAFLVRLKSFSLLSDTVFKQLRNEYIKNSEEYKKKQKRKMKEAKGGPNANKLKIYSNGESFTKIVAFSYKEGLISGREASTLLDMKLNRMEKIIPMLG
ncbi:MAG: ImmA/IrrE family metallo-endopeptidase [Bdellovibrionales bacterium]|nr:ImmA/IrrE family metallo-endopeptidase [Bdellovibrionales bacterium]